jgi:glutaredoxin
MYRAAIFLASIFLVLLWTTSACADVLRYTDDKGRTHYVESLDKVPEQYRSQLKNAKPLPNITKLAGAKYAGSYPTAVSSKSSAHKRIEIFVTSWCPYCKDLEKFLKEQNARFIRYDIEKNSEGRKLHQQLGGGGVPVIRLGSKVLRGFNADELKKELANS